MLLAEDVHAGDFPVVVDGFEGEDGFELVFAFVHVAPVFDGAGDLPGGAEGEGGPGGGGAGFGSGEGSGVGEGDGFDAGNGAALFADAEAFLELQVEFFEEWSVDGGIEGIVDAVFAAEIEGAVHAGVQLPEDVAGGVGGEFGRFFPGVCDLEWFGGDVIEGDKQEDNGGNQANAPRLAAEQQEDGDSRGDGNDGFVWDADGGRRRNAGGDGGDGFGECVIGAGPAEGVVFGFVEAGEFEAIHGSGPGDDDGGDFGESGVKEGPGESDIANGVITGSIAENDAHATAGHAHFLCGGLGGEVGEVEGVEVDAAEAGFDASAVDGGGGSGCEPFADFIADGVLFIDINEGGITVLHANDGAEGGEGNEDFVADFAGFDVDEGVDAAVAGDAERFFALFFEPEFPFLIAGIFGEGVFPIEADGGGVAGKESFGEVESGAGLLHLEAHFTGDDEILVREVLLDGEEFWGRIEGVFDFVDGGVFHHIAGGDAFGGDGEGFEVGDLAFEGFTGGVAEGEFFEQEGFVVFESLAEIVGAEAVLFVRFKALEEDEVFCEHLNAGFGAGFGNEHRRFGDGDGVLRGVGCGCGCGGAGGKFRGAKPDIGQDGNQAEEDQPGERQHVCAFGQEAAMGSVRRGDVRGIVDEEC